MNSWGYLLFVALWTCYFVPNSLQYSSYSFYTTSSRRTNSQSNSQSGSRSSSQSGSRSNSQSSGQSEAQTYDQSADHLNGQVTPCEGDECVRPCNGDCDETPRPCPPSCVKPCTRGCTTNQCVDNCVNRCDCVDDTVQEDNCCYVVHPKTCYTEETGTKRCFTRRHRECSNLCSSSVVSIQDTEGRYPRDCHYIRNYPYVYCGNYERLNCGNCYTCDGTYNPTECSRRTSCNQRCPRSIIL